MSKVISFVDFKNSKKFIKNIELTKEDRMEAKNTLIYDDDEYILRYFSEANEDLKEM